jgi:hypothetical protein
VTVGTQRLEVVNIHTTNSAARVERYLVVHLDEVGAAVAIGHFEVESAG